MKNVPRVGVGIMILNKNKQVLLGKRHKDPEKADSELQGQGTWTMPGGKLDFGESFEACAIREAFEETGITIQNPKVFCVNNDKVATAQFATIGVLIEECDDEPKVMEPDEITEWKWFDLDTLPSPMFFPSAEMAENYKQEKFYIQK
jgi:8-oxo-dGTP diphosphatase